MPGDGEGGGAVIEMVLLRILYGDFVFGGGRRVGFGRVR